VLLFQAMEDTFVSNDASALFFSRLNSTQYLSRLVRVPRSYHEILMETADVQQMVFREITSFLEDSSFATESAGGQSALWKGVMGLMTVRLPVMR